MSAVPWNIVITAMCALGEQPAQQCQCRRKQDRVTDARQTKHNDAAYRLGVHQLAGVLTTRSRNTTSSGVRSVAQNRSNITGSRLMNRFSHFNTAKLLKLKTLFEDAEARRAAVVGAMPGVSTSHKTSACARRGFRNCRNCGCRTESGDPARCKFRAQEKRHAHFDLRAVFGDPVKLGDRLVEVGEMFQHM